MVRTQIQLTDEQADMLRRVAAERGVSMAGIIRELLDRSLGDAGREARSRRALGTVGRFSSGIGDVAEEHDRHLADAFAR
jgi:hypothetical protein